MSGSDRRVVSRAFQFDVLSAASEPQSFEADLDDFGLGGRILYVGMMARSADPEVDPSVSFTGSVLICEGEDDPPILRVFEFADAFAYDDADTWTERVDQASLVATGGAWYAVNEPGDLKLHVTLSPGAELNVGLSLHVIVRAELADHPGIRIP